MVYTGDDRGKPDYPLTARADLRHLVKADEILGLRLTTIHNLHFLVRLMREIREAILAGTLPTLLAEFREHYTPVDEEARTANRAARAAAFEVGRAGFFTG